MLRVAIPNKGSLAEDSIAVLKEAGYKQRTDSRDLVLVDIENQIEFYYLSRSCLNCMKAGILELTFESLNQKNYLFYYFYFLL